MRKFTLSLAAIAVLALSVFTLPSSQASAPNPKLFSLSWELDITSTTSAQGTFEATGAIEDSGPMTEEFKFFPDPSMPFAMIGDMTLAGANGDINARFGAFIHDNGSGVLLAFGIFFVSSGTGAYEELEAIGGSISEIDLTNLTIIGGGSGIARQR